MRRPVSVKTFLSFFSFLFIYFFFFQIVPIQPSRLCRHPSIRTHSLSAPVQRSPSFRLNFPHPLMW